MNKVIDKKEYIIVSWWKGGVENIWSFSFFASSYQNENSGLNHADAKTNHFKCIHASYCSHWGISYPASLPPLSSLWPGGLKPTCPSLQTEEAGGVLRAVMVTKLLACFIIQSRAHRDLLFHENEQQGSQYKCRIHHIQCLILLSLKTWQGRYYHHHIHEKTKAQRTKRCAPGHTLIGGGWF